MRLKEIIIFVVVFFLVIEANAQQNTVASGNMATGSGGTSSYSIGQVVYTYNSETNGSVLQGVQQPYLDLVLEISETIFDLQISVYPNPTDSYLTIITKDNSNLYYQLYDTQGRIIENNIVNNIMTKIDIAELPTSIYFLNVIKDFQTVKTFKIIKK
jgi:hypothetical protein